MSARKPASYKKPKTRDSGLIDARAKCADCPWTSDGKNAMAIAAQHAGTYDHTVSAQTTMGVIYNRKEAKTG